MKQTVNLYTDIGNFSFLKKILNNLNLIQKNINDLSQSILEDDSGGIILISNISSKIKNTKNLSNNYLLISNDKNIDYLKKNLVVLEAPLSPQNIKSGVENFLLNYVFKYHDINIYHYNLLNTKNNISCSITDIEKKILIYIFQNNNCSKRDIKKNVLNLKKNIQTNSVESHLSRIRKKFEEIKTTYIIKSKNDEISIEIN